MAKRLRLIHYWNLENNLYRKSFHDSIIVEAFNHHVLLGIASAVAKMHIECEKIYATDTYNNINDSG